MANTYLKANGFLLGKLYKFNGKAGEGTTIRGEVLSDKMAVFRTASDPDEVKSTNSALGHPPSTWKNISKDKTYSEGYANDAINIDAGEALAYDGTWRRITDIDRYESTLTLSDGSKIKAIAVFATDNSGRKYLFLPDNEVNALNNSPHSLDAITLDKYDPSYDGRYNQKNFSNEFQFNITCFASGTLIETAQGHVAVETLRIGDMVRTQDHGFQPLRWINSAKVGACGIPMQSNFKPIRISANALGPGMPESTFMVSQQHRLLVSSKIVRRMFGADQVLVAAKHLLGIKGIELVEDVNEITYVHLLFDQHEIIFAHGAPVESLYLGKNCQETLTPEGRAEVLALFPNLATQEFHALYAPARPFIGGKKGRNLAKRHQKNNQCIVSG